MYICRGLREGFRIEVVAEYLEKESNLGRMLGLFTSPAELPKLQINRFGMIPKGLNTGKFRLITDLSFPPGQSVNDGIELCSLVYTSVENVAAQAGRFGRGALLAKVDIEAAYRLIPVHPQDRKLQGMKWKGAIFVDPMLPFGLRSVPKIFNAVADALHWHLGQAGIQYLFHYLDNFIMVASPNSPDCQRWLETLLSECCRLGVPIASHKTERPTTTLTFLGIEMDTIKGELRLPGEKLVRLRGELEEWSQ